MTKTKLIKRILIFIAAVAFIALLGANGDLDFDEYIEVNSTPKARYINH